MNLGDVCSLQRCRGRAAHGPLSAFSPAFHLPNTRHLCRERPSPARQSIPLAACRDCASNRVLIAGACPPPASADPGLSPPPATLGTARSGGRSARPGFIPFWWCYRYSMTHRAVRKGINSLKPAFRNLLTARVPPWLLRAPSSCCGGGGSAPGEASCFRAATCFYLSSAASEIAFLMKHHIFSLCFPARLIYCYSCKELGCALFGFPLGVSLF